MSSPPSLSSIPNIMLPTSPVKETKEMLFTKAVSPSKILPPPPSVIINQRSSNKSIQDLLPTQPLLPSQISGVKNNVVTKQLNFKQNKTKPVKTKKESQRSKTQRLEQKLSVQPILSVIDKKFKNNNRIVLDDTEEERDHLNSVEQESRGHLLNKKMVEIEENYYKLHRVCRNVDFVNFSEDEEDTLANDDDHLHSLMKKHLKRKKRKQMLLSCVDPDLEVESLSDLRKSFKSRGRGRPGRTERVAEDNLKMKRHRLWVSIMKKEVSKAGKARNYNNKEKMSNAKRLATACMRVQRLRAMESQKAMKEAFWRAKRLTREMQVK